MTGPEHFREGDDHQRAAEERQRGGDLPGAQLEATLALANYVAALVAIHAHDEPHRSVSWQEVLGR